MDPINARKRGALVSSSNVAQGRGSCQFVKGVGLVMATLFVAFGVPGGALGGSQSSVSAADGVVHPDPEARLAELGIVLPEPSVPVANYVKAVRSGNLVFLSGHGPYRSDGTLVKGKLGKDLSIEEGYEAARLTGIALLSSLKSEIGDLSKVRRVVKVFGMVNVDPSFTDQPKVINGCSDLLVEVFGERGRHARAAVGMASLPVGIAVEIDMVVEVEEN
jgi:enamine deaminase RidA (YjgF/YER057c/UK114 family)